MAANEPEAQTLRSWEDAFQGSVAGSRRLEQQLRSDVSTNKDRLRTLVGASYRSLLETAGQIVQMYDHVQSAETHLGKVGQNCNTRAIDRAKRQVSLGQDESLSQRKEVRISGGQLVLLEKCRLLASKLVKQKTSLSLAAKLLTIARLTHKTLGQRPGTIPVLETLRSKIASLRRRLLDRVDGIFMSAHTTLDEVVDAMSAFCLVTNSSSIDVLKHFQHQRLERIRRQRVQTKSKQRTISALRLWIETLRMSKDILHRRLLESFTGLRKRPIVEDPELLSLDGLDIDLLRRWIAPEVQNFTPWIKTENLSREEIQKVLESWSSHAFNEVLRVIKHYLDAPDDVATILTLRNDLLSIWLPVWNSTPSHSGIQVLDDLRKVLNECLERQLHKEIESLQEIDSHLHSIVNYDIGSKASSKKLWDHRFVKSSLSGGADTFIKELVERHTGHLEQTQKILDILGNWIKLIRMNQQLLDDSKTAKWVDIIEEEDDEMGPMDFEKQLRQDDPRAFAQIQKTSIDQALNQFQSLLVNKLQSRRQYSQPQLLIRLIRDICDTLNAAFPLSDLTILRSTITPLHEQLSDIVVNAMSPFVACRNSAIRNRNLWDGDPPMPVMPSPATVGLLRQLVKRMSEDGHDLWTTTAVDILKGKIWNSMLQKDFLEHDEISAAPVTNGIHRGSGNFSQLSNGTAKEHEESFVTTKDLQEMFDVHYLKIALTPQNQTTQSASMYDDGLAKYRKKLMVDAELSEKLQEKAVAYWNRTSLLFGPLST